MKLGNDYLAGRHYVKEMLQAHRAGDVGGIFLTTFGDAYPALEKMCASNKFSEIVVHIAPFAKSYPVARLTRMVLEHTKRLEQLSRRFPHTMLMLSPFCEHKNKRAEMEPLFRQMRALAPSCLLVNSIHQTREEVNGTITEIHIEKSSSLPAIPRNEYTVSFDGCGSVGTGDIPDLDIDAILRRYAGARHIRAWNFRFNGKFGHKDTAAIAARKHWPSVQYIRGTRALLDPREGAVTWPNSSLYKPFADDHGEKELTKDNKAMCILPEIDRNSVDVFDSRGNKIDTMRRFRPDHSGDPKGPRYYSTRHAFQIANIAYKNTGSFLGQIGGRPLTDLRKRSGRFK